MRRFETPPAPPGWTGGGATLVRIVDPLGGAIAWIAPDYGGACVGYAIRRDDDDGAHWNQILRAGSPRNWRMDPLGAGIAILGPDVDDLAIASQARWQFIERDPTAATCSARLDGTTLVFTARLEGSALHLDLRAQGDARARQPTLGMRLTFADELHRDDGSAGVPRLRTGDDRLRITLDVRGQGSLRWSAEGKAKNAVELLGESALGLVVYAEG